MRHFAVQKKPFYTSKASILHVNNSISIHFSINIFAHNLKKYHSILTCRLLYMHTIFCTFHTHIIIFSKSSNLRALSKHNLKEFPVILRHYEYIYIQFRQAVEFAQYLNGCDKQKLGHRFSVTERWICVPL